MASWFVKVGQECVEIPAPFFGVGVTETLCWETWAPPPLPLTEQVEIALPEELPAIVAEQGRHIKAHRHFTHRPVARAWAEAAPAGARMEWRLRSYARENVEAHRRTVEVRLPRLRDRLLARVAEVRDHLEAALLRLRMALEARQEAQEGRLDRLRALVLDVLVPRLLGLLDAAEARLSERLDRIRVRQEEHERRLVAIESDTVQVVDCGRGLLNLACTLPALLESLADPAALAETVARTTEEARARAPGAVGPLTVMVDLLAKVL